MDVESSDILDGPSLLLACERIMEKYLDSVSVRIIMRCGVSDTRFCLELVASRMDNIFDYSHIQFDRGDVQEQVNRRGRG